MLASVSEGERPVLALGYALARVRHAKREREGVGRSSRTRISSGEDRDRLTLGIA